MRLPAVISMGAPLTNRIGSHAPLDRRGVDERLKCRARLTVCLEGIVEFVRQKIVPADHGHDLAGLRIQGLIAPCTAGI